MLIATFLIVLLVTLAVLGGGILAWTLTIAGAAVCLVWWCQTLLTEHHTTGDVRATLAGAFILYLVMTIVPLTQSWFLPSPTRAAQNHFMQERLYDARDANLYDTGKVHVAISRNKAGTSRMILLTITTLVCAALASRLHTGRQEEFIRALVILATVLAVAGGLSQWVYPQGKNLWWLIPIEHGKPVGCFINRNHFAGYIGLMAPAALIVTATSFFNRKWLAVFLWGGCSLVLVAVIFLANSRGAWLATAAGLGVVSLLVIREKPTMGFGMAVLGILLTLGAGYTFRHQIAERLASLRHPTSTLSGQMRMDTWDDCLPLFRHYSILGAGGNAFRMVFPQVRSADTRQSFANAENEYLQIPVELGTIGTLLALALTLVVLRHWHRNRGNLPLCVHASILGAVVVCLVHACFDFATRVPLYAMTLGCLVGMTQGDPLTLQVGRPLRRPPSGSVSTGKTGGLRRGLPTYPTLALVAIVLVSLPGKRIYRLDNPDYLKSAPLPVLIEAMTWAPTSPWAWFNFGRVAMLKNDYDIRIVAERCVSAGAMYDPNNYVFWRELAPLRLTMGDKKGAQVAYDRLKSLRQWAGSAELDAELSTSP